VKVAASVRLPLDIGSVWARLLQWERQPEWMVDAASVQVLGDRRAGPGVQVAVRTKVFGIAALTDVLEVGEWDPPRRLVMVRRGFVRGRGEWRLEPAVDGGTRFTWEERLRAPIPILGELALAAYRPLMRRLMQRSLSNLADALR
jgi:Polyketide cyclase / dehydrase and lipid transport